MERVTSITKSFIIAIALVRGRIDVEEAAQAAHVEVNSQIKRWGEVEDCKHLQSYHTYVTGALNNLLQHTM